MTAHNAMPEPFIFPARRLYAAGAFQLDVAGGRPGHAGQHVHARARARRSARSRWSARSTSWPSGWASTRSSCGCATSRSRIPTDGPPFSSRHLVEAYRAGAERFGWDRRDPTPGARREGEWLVGMGCATATYPYYADARRRRRGSR